MSAHAGGMCMSQYTHWRIPIFRFPSPARENGMQANPSVSTKNTVSAFADTVFFCIEAKSVRSAHLISKADMVK